MPIMKEHPAVREVKRLLIPRIIGSAVYQASVLVDTIFASFSHLVGAGGVASLYFAHRFLHLPLALFGISMAQAALPTLASQAASSDLAAVRRTVLLALRSSLVVSIPAGVGLIVLAQPIIATLLERGAFSSEATDLTKSALRWYALGLGCFCAVKVLVNTLYALHDTWTPVRSAAIALFLNLVLNLILIWPMGLSGLALATSLSSAFNCFHLYWVVQRRIGSLTEGFREWMMKVVVASGGMGLVAFGVWHGGLSLVGDFHLVARLLLLFLAIVSGMATFFLMSFSLKVEEARSVSDFIRSRVARTSTD